MILPSSEIFEIVKKRQKTRVFRTGLPHCALMKKKTAAIIKLFLSWKKVKLFNKLKSWQSILRASNWFMEAKNAPENPG